MHPPTPDAQPVYPQVAQVQPIYPLSQAPQHNYPPPVIAPPQVYYQQIISCRTCGGDGRGLADGKVMCPECRWLKPLVPGYQVDNAAFGWAADFKAMSALRAITPLNAAAKAVSERVGRRWIEAAFNGVLLSEKQLPQIFGQSVRAARILGMSHMPDVYLSGDRPWDCLTFGTDKDSFIVIGSALAGNFQGVDMLFLLAREMGHCKAGHALWKTVIRFLLGEQGNSKGMLAGGIFSAILNPTALIGGAIEMPLLAWARQAEITADRAGLLAVGNEAIARRVLLSWSLRSSVMYRQINIDAWIEQQSGDDGGYTRLSEVTMSSTPYLGPRMKLLSQYANSPDFQLYVERISAMLKQSAPPPRPAHKADSNADVIRLKCATCSTQMRIPIKLLEGKTELPVKCPNAKCGAITQVKKKRKPPTSPPAPRPRKIEENVDDGE
jgi:Zn-dependent protease with chaperone function